MITNWFLRSLQVTLLLMWKGVRRTMMMKIEVDWTKAPEGTTHYGPETDRLHAAWYKKVDSRWMAWIVDVSNEWYFTGGLPSSAIARPSEWGRADLPPVGTKCVVEVYKGAWRECVVVAHFEGRVVVVLNDREAAKVRDADQLRPIHTPERIAAEKREREINELVEVIVTHYEYPKGAESYIGLARALHNAGYRKTEQEKNNE